MPYKEPKPNAEEITQIAAWIDLGAPYDRPLVDKSSPTAKKPMTVPDEDRQFWSFLPLKRPIPPEARNKAWCKTPIDRFIMAKLEEKGLTPSPPVDRRKLIRRASFDLIALPPPPEEVESFVNHRPGQA